MQTEEMPAQTLISPYPTVMLMMRSVRFATKEVIIEGRLLEM